MPISEGMGDALDRLAKVTVEKGLDPGKVIKGLMDMMEMVNNLTPAEREQLREELREVRSAHLDT